MQYDEFKDPVTKLCDFYDEISSEELMLEIPRYRRHVRAANVADEALKWTAMQSLEFIVKYDFMDSLPNLALSLRLYLTICVSVASCERSFSKLKLIKSYLRSKMTEDRLTNLGMLSIEHGKVKDLDIDTMIDKFASLKARRVPLV